MREGWEGRVEQWVTECDTKGGGSSGILWMRLHTYPEWLEGFGCSTCVNWWLWTLALRPTSSLLFILLWTTIIGVWAQPVSEQQDVWKQKAPTAVLVSTKWEKMYNWPVWKKTVVTVDSRFKSSNKMRSGQSHSIQRKESRTTTSTIFTRGLSFNLCAWWLWQSSGSFQTSSTKPSPIHRLQSTLQCSHWCLKWH